MFLPVFLQCILHTYHWRLCACFDITCLADLKSFGVIWCHEVTLCLIFTTWTNLACFLPFCTAGERGICWKQSSLIFGLLCQKLESPLNINFQQIQNSSDINIENSFVLCRSTVSLFPQELFSNCPISNRMKTKIDCLEIVKICDISFNHGDDEPNTHEIWNPELAFRPCCISKADCQPIIIEICHGSSHWLAAWWSFDYQTVNCWPTKENIVIVLFIKNDATASSQRGTTTNGLRVFNISLEILWKYFFGDIIIVFLWRYYHISCVEFWLRLSALRAFHVKLVG